MHAALNRFDVLLAPTYANFPPRIADTKSDLPSKEHIVEQMRRYGFHTTANYSGAPAMSVPMGFSEDGLPIGLHVMAKRFDEMAATKTLSGTPRGVRVRAGDAVAHDAPAVW